MSISKRRVVYVAALIVGALAASRAAPVRAASVASEEQLRTEFAALAERLAIPGLSYGVVRNGEVVLEGAVGFFGSPDQPFSVDSPVDVASISKSIAAVAVMQAVERGELELSDAVRSLLPDFSGPASVTVRHLLSHTSEGIPGEEFMYMPTRFALLGSILERVVGQPYPSIVRERILAPAGMVEHPSPNLTAGWGLISTAGDLFKYAMALDKEVLIERQAQDQMASPVNSPRGVDLPVGLGWFCREIQGEPVAWGFGQESDGESSALFFRVPRLQLTLVIVAESDRLSNPFRLLHGDVRSSPFAMAFFRNFVASSGLAGRQPADWASLDVAELSAELDTLETPGSYNYGSELVAHAFVELESDPSRAGDLFELALRRYPDLEPSLSWLELANWLGRESLGPFAARLADRLVTTRPMNPWVLTAAGSAYMEFGDPLEAVATWSRVAALPNRERHFLNTSLNAMAWNDIGEYWLEKDPGLARTFFLRAIETGGGWELSRSQRLLRDAAQD